MLDPVTKVRRAIECSQLVRTVAAIRRDRGRWFALGTSKLRRLSRQEVAQLESNGNVAEDWSKLRVVVGFDARRVRDSSFHGEVVLGRFTQRVLVADGLELPAGIYRSTLADCVVGNEALVHDVSLLANYVVGEWALLMHCGTIVCSGRTTFGNGTVLALGIESGGRDVPVFAEIDIETAAAVARCRSRPQALRRYLAAVADYVARVRSVRGIIAEGARVRHTSRIRDSYLGPFARVDGATALSESTLLSSQAEPAQVLSGACVDRSLLQWGSGAATQAVVNRSVLTEHAQVRRHGQVSRSILGPNSAVAGGEVTASLVGPFVNLQHQALLIGTVWPEGKGNVGAGARVGANHTSRAPDQEFWPGEGMFFGLGVNVQFPADFRRAPYTVIAAGVTTLPQRVSFPFALLKAPSHCCPGIPPAYNEIVPAWVLTDNLFALKRNVMKYRARDRAQRTRFEFRVFRPQTVDLMRDACRRLEAVTQTKEVYTEGDIDGLGKNFLLETHRRPAIATYRFFTGYYALLGLHEHIQELLRQEQCGAISDLLSRPSDQPLWEHQRRILYEDLGATDVIDALQQLPDFLEEVAGDVERSKAKDDERGQRIIDDYAQVHVPAAEHPVVRQIWHETARLQRQVQELIAKLAQHC